MESQSLLNPSIFLALVPTVLFIGLTIIFVRWRRITGGLLQRWARENRQRLIDKSR